MTTPEEDAFTFAKNFIKSQRGWELVVADSIIPPLPPMTASEEEEASAFAENWIKALPGWELVMADSNVKESEKLAHDARIAFTVQFGTDLHPTNPGDSIRRRLLEERSKEVYEIVKRGAIRHKLHELTQDLKKLKDEEENLKDEEENLKNEEGLSEAELRAKIKELDTSDDEDVAE